MPEGDMDCSVDGCPNPAARNGRCWGHVKRGQRGEPVGTELARRPSSPLERLTEAALAYAESETDEDFARARDNLRKAAAAYGRRGASDAIRQAIADRKARGDRVGRPPKVDPAKARELVASVGLSAAARLLSVSRMAVWRALQRKSVA